MFHDSEEAITHIQIYHLLHVKSFLEVFSFLKLVSVVQPLCLLVPAPAGRDLPCCRPKLYQAATRPICRPSRQDFALSGERRT